MPPKSKAARLRSIHNALAVTNDNIAQAANKQLTSITQFHREVGVLRTIIDAIEELAAEAHDSSESYTAGRRRAMEIAARGLDASAEQLRDLIEQAKNFTSPSEVPNSFFGELAEVLVDLRITTFAPPLPRERTNRRTIEQAIQAESEEHDDKWTAQPPMPGSWKASPPAADNNSDSQMNTSEPSYPDEPLTQAINESRESVIPEPKVIPPTPGALGDAALREMNRIFGGQS